MFFSPMGDMAVNIGFSDVISPETNEEIRLFALMLEKTCIKGVKEWVPAYTALTIYYDPLLITYAELVSQLKKIKTKNDSIELPPRKIIYIPTCYGGKYGPDLSTVASYCRLSEEEVIEIHSSSSYLIYMMGFTPGFPYLGGMPKELATPRLTQPRQRVAAGSVGIAGEQTGIYPMETPGGWQIIGKIPLPLYDPKRKSPILLQAGNYIKFVPITSDVYEKLENQVDASFDFYENYS